MRRVKSVAYFLVFISLAGLAAWAGPKQWNKWFKKEPEQVFIPTARAEKGEVVISLKELGNIEAERSIEVSSEIEGKIIFMAQEGQTVSAGQLLVQLDDTPLRNRLRETTLQYGNAQAQVDKARLEMEILKEQNRTEVEQQEAQLNFDKTELERSRANLEKKRRLAEDRLIPQSEVEVAEIDVRAKEFSVRKGEASLELKRKEVESRENQKLADVANVEFAAQMAKSAMEEAESALAKAAIRAPASGLLVINKTWTPDGRRKFKEGDGVYPRQQIIQLPDLSSMLAKVQVDEADIAKVRVGMKARISLDALPGKKFTGEVKEISSLATEAMPWETTSSPGRKNFEVVIRIAHPANSPLRPGMTASVEIINDSIPNAVYVPIEAVFEKKDGRVVYVKSGNDFREQQVKTGKRNETVVVIESGLKANQVVALRDPTRQSTQEAPEAEPAARPAPLPSAEARTSR